MVKTCVFFGGLVWSYVHTTRHDIKQKNFVTSRLVPAFSRVLRECS